jgi:hypothetical protein
VGIENLVPGQLKPLAAVVAPGPFGQLHLAQVMQCGNLSITQLLLRSVPIDSYV